jgi:hypothetical protein
MRRSASLPKRGTLLPRLAGAPDDPSALLHELAAVGPTLLRQKTGNWSATSHREAAGPGTGSAPDEARERRSPGLEPKRATEEGSGTRERGTGCLTRPDRGDLRGLRAPHCLTPLGLAICSFGWKRNGISIGCEPVSTSLQTQVSGFRPRRFDELRKPSGKAGARAMGHREAALHGAFADTIARPPARLRHAALSLKRLRSFPRCMEQSFHPPIGGCGMRIAEPLGEAPASHGNRQPTEEMA